MIEINGMAHVILAVSEWERCRPFYEALLSFLGLTRVFSGEDVDKVFAFLREQDAKIVHTPEGGPWAPGYYSVLFEDPIGTRIEVNYVPGKGVLAEDAGFNAAGDYR